MKVKRVLFFKGLFLASAFFFLGLDQYFKLHTIERLSVQEFQFITNWWNWVYVQNYGGLFGLFSSWKVTNLILLVVGVCISTGTLVYALFFIRNFFLMMCFSLLLAGAVGNTLDRVLHGFVVDWIDWHLGNWHWPSFNLADVYLTCFVLLFLAFSFVEKK